MNVPFHVPYYDSADERALVDAFRRGKLVGDGDHTHRASAALADLVGAPQVLLTTSCTHALELAMMVIDLRPGDEVIVPSFTFVSTTNAILRQGARPVFADIEPATLTIDPAEVEHLATPRTRAVIPVVYGGVSPDMAALTELGRRRGLVIVEDAAQGVDAYYRGQHTGTVGDIGCFSFHETKNFSTGEGGAFVTRNAAYLARAEIIREKGTNRKQFLQGLVDKYTWVDVGSSFLPPDHTGALLLSQLAKREEIGRLRRAVHERYMEAFRPLAERGALTLPAIPPGVRTNYHIFWVLFRDEETRNGAIAHFRSRGVGTTFHYLPLHLSPVGQRLGYAPGACPLTESVSGRLLRLPIYPALAPDQQDHVIATMEEFLAP